MGAVCSGEGGADELVFSGAVDDSTAIRGCAAKLVDEFQVDPRAALRFARARQGDFSKAKPLLQADLAWRAHKTPAAQDDCPTALASGNLRMLGFTSKGESLFTTSINTYQDPLRGRGGGGRAWSSLTHHPLLSRPPCALRARRSVGPQQVRRG